VLFVFVARWDLRACSNVAKHNFFEGLKEGGILASGLCHHFYEKRP
jgi:hypothetical protein